ncbi:hypothetical protein brsh051_09410 [Brooklawnia propionicigenes]|uniref:Cell wall-active antibiotics response LiaF-like C-terminal domain-containing protein n=1 Tax=Brooklawnia propionicigenes TaxID=3041175 RepID=A0AAN0K6B9_9ACTN|nr:DUF1707 domain-containing protein [Brooklawnia sp. SH051]BEH01660.1 hypothetical protein brsh051_09410 [Brooklawnia sp. SH051]
MSHDDDFQDAPRQRAGDADRQQAIEALTRAWREGRITRDEFQERSPQALGAVYLDELDDLLSDLGGLTASPAPQAVEPGVVSYQSPVPAGDLIIQDSWQSEPDEPALPAVYAPEGTKGSALSVGVMSGVDRAGEWTVAPTHVSIAVMGGTSIDLREAIFTSDTTIVTCFAIMGGTDVIVPPEMDVEVNGIGFMGGFGWEKPRYVKATRPAPEGNPRVIINGLGFWGAVNIVRLERGEEYDGQST